MSEPHDFVWALTTTTRLAREAEQSRIISLLKDQIMAYCTCAKCAYAKEFIAIIKGE